MNSPIPSPATARTLLSRLDQLAGEDPTRTALTEEGDDGATRSMSAAVLAHEVRSLAGRLRTAGPGGSGTLICLAARNTIETAVIILASLEAALPLFPHSSTFDDDVLDDILAGQHATVGQELVQESPGPPGSGSFIYRARLAQSAQRDLPAYFLATSGSTGTPRMMPFRMSRSYDPRAVPDVAYRSCAWTSAQRQLIVLPLYHIGNFRALVQGVLDGNHVILAHGGREGVVRAFARHRPEWTILTPGLMAKILPAVQQAPEVVSSLRALVHTAMPCPPALKWAWIDLLGPERVFEMYGATEGVGMTLIRGDQWIAHPGAVGRGLLTRISILDEERREMPVGQIGQVFLRRSASGRPSADSAAWLESLPDGSVSLGDTGWVDRDGYLYLFDRVTNKITRDGQTAWLGRITLTLMAHRGVADAECVPVHPARGGPVAIHAFIAPALSGAPDIDELRAHCATHLDRHERPDEYVFVPRLPRTETGKPDRRALLRLGTGSAQSTP